MSKLIRSENQTKGLEIVKFYEQYELSKGQFCDEQNIKKATLDYWIRKSRFLKEPEVMVATRFANLISEHQVTDDSRLHFGEVDNENST